MEYSREDLATEVDPAGDGVALHAGGCVDSVTEQTVAWHLDAHHTRHHWPCVDTHPDLPKNPDEGKNLQALQR